MMNGMSYWRLFFSVFIVLTIAAAWVPTMNSSATYSGKSNLSYMEPRGELSSLKKADAWLNSKPLTAQDLKGKVVLVQFWTYTCINWMRTLPYMRAWAGKYKDMGLVVIGVHTPEFFFEQNVENVRWATKDMKINFPIALDNKREIWNAFNNQYWPALYFIDSKGNIRSYQFGEGEYEKSERIIQQLLSEAKVNNVSDDFVSVIPNGTELAADWKNLKSPENYLGFERTENFSTPKVIEGKNYNYTGSSDLKLNYWSLFGEWTVRKELIHLNKAGGRISYRFQARDLNLVMGPAQAVTSVRFRILINGRPPGAAHGIDVDEMGYGTLTEQRLYQLVRQPGTISDLTFEIEFLDAGAETFAFTFG